MAGLIILKSTRLIMKLSTVFEYEGLVQRKKVDFLSYDSLEWNGVFMLKIVLIFPVILLIFWCCSMEEHDFKSEGAIIGKDDRECVCCGGYFIDIADSTYRFYSVPPGSNLKLENPHFPIYVKLDWHKEPNACLGDEIIVERIEQR